MDLAIAVFEEGLDEIEAAVATRPEGEPPFTACWNEFVVRTVNDSAFVQTAVSSFNDPRFYKVWRRLEGMMRDACSGAVEEGILGPDVGLDRVFLGLRAIYGVVSTASEPNARTEADVRTVLSGLSLPVPEVIVRPT